MIAKILMHKMLSSLARTYSISEGVFPISGAVIPFINPAAYDTFNYSGDPFLTPSFLHVDLIVPVTVVPTSTCIRTYAIHIINEQ